MLEKNPNIPDAEGKPLMLNIAYLDKSRNSRPTDYSVAIIRALKQESFTIEYAYEGEYQSNGLEDARKKAKNLQRLTSEQIQDRIKDHKDIIKRLEQIGCPMGRFVDPNPRD